MGGFAGATGGSWYSIARMLAVLVKLVRILHGTIGISDPGPGEELPIALAWVALLLAMVAVFVIGLFYL